MTTEQPAIASEEDEAHRLRNALADQLREQGHITDDRVEAAVRTVRRDLFIPSVPLAGAYTNEVVYTKHDKAGAISAASQPSIVTMMLEQLRVEGGQNILEIGAGTGYNAALLAHLTGSSGHVTTIDVDDDLVTDARAHLSDAGVRNVEVILGDGALGHSENAPYDRIIATVATADLPPPWLEQISPTGRLVAPVRIAGSATRSIAFELDGDRWLSVDSQLCGFMPLRASVAADPRRILKITNDGSVTLHAYSEQDIELRALAGILDTAAHEIWTDLGVADDESVDPVWLWLACALPNSLSRMPVQPEAIESELVKPMFRWGSMATVAGNSLAYLTARPASNGCREIGVVGHGPDGLTLAETTADQIIKWSKYRLQPIDFEFRPGGAQPEPRPGRYVITRPSGTLTVTWQT